MPAHLAVEEEALDDLFRDFERTFQPLIADLVPQRVQGNDSLFEGLVEEVEATRMTHRPKSNRVHGDQPSALVVSVPPASTNSFRRSSG